MKLMKEEIYFMLEGMQGAQNVFSGTRTKHSKIIFQSKERKCIKLHAQNTKTSHDIIFEEWICQCVIT